MNWDDLRFLMALHRAGSLNGAARLLKVEASTVSRRLGSLEGALGAQLAARTPEGFVLNDAGQLAASLAETMDAGIQELLRRVGGDDQKPEGIVRLSCTESIAPLLMRGLLPLREAHPKIHVELAVTSAALDLVRREADVAVRFFRDPNPSLIVKKVADVGWSLYASRSYVERTNIKLAADLNGCCLAGQSVIGYRGPASRALGGVWLAEHSRREDVVFSGDAVMAVLNAVRAGLGVSVLPCYAVHEDESFVRLSPEVVGRSELYLVIPPDHKTTVRVRYVMDAVIELARRERALLEGTG